MYMDTKKNEQTVMEFENNSFEKKQLKTTDHVTGPSIIAKEACIHQSSWDVFLSN